MLSYSTATAASVFVLVCVILPVVGVCTILSPLPPCLLPSNYNAVNKNQSSDRGLSPPAGHMCWRLKPPHYIFLSRLSIRGKRVILAPSWSWRGLVCFLSQACVLAQVTCHNPAHQSPLADSQSHGSRSKEA